MDGAKIQVWINSRYMIVVPSPHASELSGCQGALWAVSCSALYGSFLETCPTAVLPPLLQGLDPACGPTCDRLDSVTEGSSMPVLA